MLILKWGFFICSLAPAKKCPFRRWRLWCAFQHSKRNKNLHWLAEEFWRKLKATRLPKMENKLVWSERNPRSDRWLLNNAHQYNIQAIDLYGCTNIRNRANSRSRLPRNKRWGCQEIKGAYLALLRNAIQKKLNVKAAVKVVSLTPITIFTNITLNLMIQSQVRTKKLGLKWTISLR